MAKNKAHFGALCVHILAKKTFVYLANLWYNTGWYRIVVPVLPGRKVRTFTRGPNRSNRSYMSYG